VLTLPLNLNAQGAGQSWILIQASNAALESDGRISSSSLSSLLYDPAGNTTTSSASRTGPVTRTKWPVARAQPNTSARPLSGLGTRAPPSVATWSNAGAPLLADSNELCELCGACRAPGAGYGLCASRSISRWSDELDSRR